MKNRREKIFNGNINEKNLDDLEIKNKSGGELGRPTKNFQLLG